MEFRKLIRNLRIEKEFKELCSKKGLNKVLAHKIALCMFLEKTNLRISQELGIHLTTTKEYKKILGGLEESKFNQFINLPQVILLNKQSKPEAKK